MTILSPKSQSSGNKSIGNEVVFRKTRPGTRTRMRSELLWNTLDVFGNLRTRMVVSFSDILALSGYKTHAFDPEKVGRYTSAYLRAPRGSKS